MLSSPETLLNMCIRKQNFNHAAEVIKVGLFYPMLRGIIAFMYSLFNNTCKSYMRQLISTLRLVFILKGYKIENNYVKIIHKYVPCTLYLVREKYFLLTHNFISMYDLI